MCFQYKWPRSRKEKIKGKGQTKQIKLASLPDFNIYFHSFGNDPSSKFFSQGRRMSPREEGLASKYHEKLQTSSLHTEGIVSRSGVLTCLQFLLVKLLKKGPRGTHMCAVNPSCSHIPENAQEKGGPFINPIKLVLLEADLLTLWPPAVIRGTSPFLRLRVTLPRGCSKGMQFRADKTNSGVQENGASSDRETRGRLPATLFTLNLLYWGQKTKQHPHSETQDPSKSGMFLKTSFYVDYF